MSLKSREQDFVTNIKRRLSASQPAARGYIRRLSRPVEARVQTFFAKETTSGFKYALIWAAFVTWGSWMFLYLEGTTASVPRDHEHWARFKKLLSTGDVVEELDNLAKELRTLCNVTLFSEMADRLLLVNGSPADSSVTETTNLTPVQPETWVSMVESSCNDSLTIVEHVTNHSDYNMVDAVYYTMTLVTTIGFGHIAPTTQYGRIFAIFYALVGVPLTCILMTKNSEILSMKMLTLYKSIKKRYRDRHDKLVLTCITWVYLLVGYFVFLFLPALVFVYLEEWTFVDANYFTFITLSTIGFGDFIAGYDMPHPYKDFYRVGIVIWIMIALGYWILLLNFLQKAIKSKTRKKLKKVLNSKGLQKQLDFMRQLIVKVKDNIMTDTEEDKDEDNIVTLMKEVTSVMHLENAALGEVRRRRSSYRHMSECSDIKITLGNQEEEEEEEEDIKPPELTLTNLLNVNVSLKCDTHIASINSILSDDTTVTTVNGGKVTIPRMQFDDNQNEITLPLREVFGLVALVASLADVEFADYMATFYEEAQSLYSGSPLSTVTASNNTKEEAPLLQDVISQFQERRASLQPLESYGSNIQDICKGSLRHIDSLET